MRDLQLIVEVGEPFLYIIDDLMAPFCQIFYSSMLRLLGPKTISIIFANVEDILLTNTTFLSSLEERQRSCRLYIDTIGDILDKDMVNMINYKVRLSFNPLCWPITMVGFRITVSIRQTRSKCCNQKRIKMQIFPLFCRYVSIGHSQGLSNGGSKRS